MLRELPRVVCPRCRSAEIDTSLRTDPMTRRSRKRCRCGQCHHEFWHSDGVVEKEPPR